MRTTKQTQWQRMNVCNTPCMCRYWSEDTANEVKFPLFVSIDGGHLPTKWFASALNYATKLQVIQNLRDPTRCKEGDGYCNLSVHYQMLLQLFFECHKMPRLIFLEEDLEIAPDFFGYLEALVPITSNDKSILCVSAWNDHGQHGRASNTTALYRTDIMPGLGWMLTANVGNELHPVWPDRYWDDWMRTPEIRKGRQCIFPEVARTKTFGSVGTSNGAAYKEHLHTILLNHEKTNWGEMVSCTTIDLMPLRSHKHGE